MSKKMKEISVISDSKIPSKKCTAFFSQANNYISIINNTTNDNGKKEQALIELETLIKALEDTYPGSYFAASSQYQTMHDQLFTEMKEQWNELGRTSLLKETSQKTPLTELIANISPKKVNKLTEILIHGKKSELDQLKTLYETDDTSEEATNFREFLKNHEIEYLGGGNSKNFKVTNIKDSTCFVLKIDYRFDLPKKIETDLYNSTLNKSFSRVEVERQVICRDEKNKKVTRALMVTEYHKNGSLPDLRKNIKDTATLKKATIEYMEALGALYEDLQDQSFFFPDSKISNVLVTENNKLCIADTKSFVKVNKDGNFIKGELPENQYTGLVQTVGFTPPEYNTSKNRLNNEHAHAFIYGANIYSFITGKTLLTKAGQVVEGKNLDFKHEFFQSYEGKKIGDLIISLVKSNPKNRMSVRKAHNELFLLKHPEFSKAFKHMELLRYGGNIKEIDQYIKTKQKEINSAADEEIKKNLLKEVEEKVLDLQFKQDVKDLNELKFFENEEKLINLIKDKITKINEAPENNKKQKLLGEVKDLYWNSKLEQLKNRFNFSKLDELIIESEKELKEAPGIKNILDVLKEVESKFKREQGFHDQKKLQKNDEEKQEKLKNDLDLALISLERLKFGINDNNMSKFIEKKRKDFKNASGDEKTTLIKDLQNTVNLLSGKPTEHIKTIINDYRNKAGFFTIGMNRKANRLEQAMNELSIEERCEFNNNPYSMKGILKALASHRFSGKTLMKKEGNEEQVDENKAATAFKTFKKQYIKKVDKLHVKDINEQQEIDVNTSNNKKF